MSKSRNRIAAMGLVAVLVGGVAAFLYYRGLTPSENGEKHFHDLAEQAGWTEALQLMPQGSKWEIVIPSELAYGAGGQGPIPPSSVLVFEVELLDIKAPEAAAE